jgi:hypothetical protein
MRTVVLGAGASYGASKNAGFPCPLVSGILSTAQKAGLTSATYGEAADSQLESELLSEGTSLEAVHKALGSPPRVDHLYALRAFVEEQFGLTESTYDLGVDFERLFSMVEAELLGYHGLLKHLGKPPKGPSAPDVLEMQFMLVLCGSILAALRDVRCTHHDAIAQWLRKGDAVVSFNYDTLIDRSLRGRGSWFPDDGYGLRFHRHGLRKGDGVTWRAARETASDVTLLKPHGSMNWLYPVDSWESMMHLDLHGRPHKDVPPVIYCLDDLEAQFEKDHPLYEWWGRYDHEAADYIYDLHSLIVPPMLSKPYRNLDAMIGPIWAQLLLRLLTRTTELYLIGYSIRPDDARSWWLFRKVASEATSLKTIVVIDPSDEVYERVKSALKPRDVVRGPRTIGEFASQL